MPPERRARRVQQNPSEVLMPVERGSVINILPRARDAALLRQRAVVARAADFLPFRALAAKVRIRRSRDRSQNIPPLNWDKKDRKKPSLKKMTPENLTF
jgi:hypothetical protein